MRGYVWEKLIEPRFGWRGSGEEKEEKGRGVMGMGEVYVNVGEWWGGVDEVGEGLGELKMVGKGGGMREVRRSEVREEMGIMKWVEKEGLVEVWGEGEG